MTFYDMLVALVGRQVDVNASGESFEGLVLAVNRSVLTVQEPPTIYGPGPTVSIMLPGIDFVTVFA